MDHGNSDKERKRSGQIPRFGEWEDARELPITRYFENARQAGLLRDHIHSSSSSSAETLQVHPHVSHGRPPLKQTAVRTTTTERMGPQRRARDVSDQAGKQYAYVSRAKQRENDDVERRPSRVPKPVDEDLYKIPPELILRSSKRKRIPGLFSCLVPCTS